MVTDDQVEETLRTADETQGKYLDDDPELEVILQQIELRGQ